MVGGRLKKGCALVSLGLALALALLLWWLFHVDKDVHYSHVNRMYALSGVDGASFSPRDDNIVFAYQVHGKGGIYLMDQSGVVRKLLAPRDKGPEVWMGSPVFSPDGESIAFVSDMLERRGDLFIMSKDGSNLRRLTRNNDHDREPAFSHDGRRVYFLRHPLSGDYPSYDTGPHNSGVFYVDLDTGQERSALRDNSFGYLPAFALLPENIILLPLGRGPLRCQTFVAIDLEHQEQKTGITPDLSAYTQSYMVYGPDCPAGYPKVHHFVASRDGRYLVFAWEFEEYPWPGRHQLYLLDLSDGRVTKLTDLPRSVYPLDISADNKKILCIDQTRTVETSPGYFAVSNLWIVDADGSCQRNIPLDFRRLPGQDPPAGAPPGSPSQGEKNMPSSSSAQELADFLARGAAARERAQHQNLDHHWEPRLTGELTGAVELCLLRLRAELARPDAGPGLAPALRLHLEEVTRDRAEAAGRLLVDMIRQEAGFLLESVTVGGLLGDLEGARQRVLGSEAAVREMSKAEALGEAALRSCAWFWGKLNEEGAALVPARLEELGGQWRNRLEVIAVTTLHAAANQMRMTAYQALAGPGPSRRTH